MLWVVFYYFAFLSHLDLFLSLLSESNTIHSILRAPLSTASYSFINLSTLEQRRMKEFVQGLPEQFDILGVCQMGLQRSSHCHVVFIK